MHQSIGIKELENDLIKLWIKDGILYSEYKQPIVITIENAQKFISMRHEISNNEKQYWCYDFTHMRPVPKEVLAYVEVHGQDYLYASAAVVKSHIAMFIFNSFALFKKARIPFRMFTSKEKAVAWLKELKKQNEK